MWNFAYRLMSAFCDKDHMISQRTVTEVIEKLEGYFNILDLEI